MQTTGGVFVVFLLDQLTILNDLGWNEENPTEETRPDRLDVLVLGQDGIGQLSVRFVEFLAYFHRAVAALTYVVRWVEWIFNAEQ